MINVLVIVVIIGYYIYLAFGRAEIHNSYFKVLAKIILIELLILSFVFVFSKNEYINSRIYGDGFSIPSRFVDYLYYFVLFPTIIAIFDLVIRKSNGIFENLGIPIFLIPKTNMEFLFFVFFILVGVIFEEIVMRYYLFHYLNKLFSIKGDVVMIIGTIVVGLGHLYQNIKGILLAILGHLVLSKIYLVTDSILTTIILHFIMDMSIILEVIRIKYLTKSATT